MNITPDTNVLVRVVARDDETQSRAAEAVLSKAELIALSLPGLCEFVWVLSQRYGIESREIATTIRRLISSANVAVNRAAVESGLQMLESGGDFADGVIAYEGRWSGGDVFVSFDRQAVRLLGAQGKKAQLLA